MRGQSLPISNFKKLPRCTLKILELSEKAPVTFVRKLQMKNFYEIRHLRKKCFLNIYILVPIFIPLKMSFMGTRIFQEQF